MGLWNFVKDKGKSLFGMGAEASEAPQAEALKKEVKDLGLDASGLDIQMEGDKVRVSGKAVSPEVKEKVILAVGNVAGVAAVEAEDEAGGKPVFYEVKKGDTLSAISKSMLGDANRYREIFEANKPMLKDPDKIYPGQTLRIPRS
jgi:nucleoid-associated protein YgaU